MRKLFLLLFAALLVCCFVGCDQDAEPKVAAVSFDANGATGRVPSTINVRIGKSFSVPSKGSLEKRGYDFAGWNTSPSGNGTQFASYRSGTANEDMTLYAQWKIHTYSIEYDYMYGELPPEEWNRSNYTVDTESFQLANPTREGYEFLGWKLYGSDDSTAKKSYLVEKGSVGDLHFVAAWRQLSSWTVSYNANGGNGWVSSQTKYEGGAVTILDAFTIERKGYGFVCWNTKEDGSGVDYRPNDTYEKDDSLSLYAKWEILEYSIKYDLIGGFLEDEASNPDAYTVETASFTLKNPVKEGHVFLGWKNAGSADSTARSSFVFEKGSYGDRSLVAVWRPLKELMISFYANAASSEDAYSSVKVMEGESFVIPSGEELSRNGYDFASWNTRSSGNGTKYEPSQEVVVDCDLKLYAQWSLHNYSINYDLAGGYFSAGLSLPDHYTIETRTFALNEPSKNGSTFLGWKLAGSNDSSANKSVSIEKGSYGDLSFVAVWGHVISYDSNGGKGSLESQTKLEGATLVLATAEGFSRDGYKFDCWNTKADGSGTNYQQGSAFDEDRDATLYAKWTIVSYPITYDFNGGYLPDGSFNLDSYTIETDTFALANPKRNGDWTFIGWKLSEVEDQTAQEFVKIQKGSTGAKSFVAVWGHYVSYNINGGYGEVKRQIKYEKTPLILASFEGLSRKGYSIETWNTSSDGSGTNYNPGSLFNGDRNMVLYAKWNIEHYEISYELDGGLLPDGLENPLDYTVETPTFELHAPEKDGYKFLGWKLAGSDDSYSNPDIKIARGSTGDKTYVAVWQPLNSYWVQYVANGGSGSVGRQIKYEGVPLTISDATGLSRDGYDFVCWNTFANGSGTNYLPGDLYKVDSNLTLYAQWRIVSYKVEYDLDGGTLPVGCSNPATYTMESESFTLVNPSKEGYEFLGWKIFGYPDSTACKTVSIEKGSLGAKAFVAVWRQLNRYKVTYNANGGTGSIESQSKLEGHSLIVSNPLNIARIGYFFKEWNTKADGSGESYNPGDSYNVDQDLVLYARWRVITYEIEYDLVGGVVEGADNPSTYTVEKDTFTLTNPVKEGYRFLGWKVLGSSDETALETIEIKKGSTGDKSFVAVWKQLVKYTISYDSNGGAGSIPSQTKYEGDLVVLCDSNSFEREGFRFASWNTSPDGNGTTYYPRDVFTDDRTLLLYAIWVEDPLSYKYLPDTDSYSVTLKDRTVSSVMIPSEYKGKSVTEIGYSAFIDCLNLTSVKIPSGVTRIGDYAFCRCSSLTGIEIPDSVTIIGDFAFWKCKGLTVLTISTTSKLESIGKSAFDSCGALTGNLMIPDSVTTIGNEAFWCCRGLTSLTISNASKLKTIGRSSFSCCDGITGVLIIPDEVISIGDGAFYMCRGLERVAISNASKLEIIGLNAFYSCSGLTGNLTIPNSVTSIGDHAFFGCSGLTGSLIIPDKVSVIGSGAFSGCSGLANIEIPAGVVSIGSGAFAHCSGLTGDLVIPDSVTSIGDWAFWNCSNLDGLIISSMSELKTIGKQSFDHCSGLTGNLIIPDGIVSIGDGAFGNCSGLTGLMISTISKLETIGESAFEKCSGLTGNLTIPDSVTCIGNDAFWGCNGLTSLTISNTSKLEIIGRAAFLDCSGLTGILTIPDGVESIGDSAFKNCRGLSGVIRIPNGITIIGDYVFYGCSGLTGSLVIPDGVTSIGDYAFWGCSGLTGSLVIPDGVTNVGDSAFSRCSGLSGLEISNVSKLEIIGDYSFGDCNGLIGSLVMPNGVTSIGRGAFYNCSGLSGFFTIPRGVTSIEDYTLCGCSNITSIRIPVGVTSIGAYAFGGDGSEKEIHYVGSGLQWETVTKNPNWDSGLTYTLFFDS